MRCKLTQSAFDTAGAAGAIGVAFLAPPTIPLLCNPYTLGPDGNFSATVKQECRDAGRVLLDDVDSAYQNLRCPLSPPADAAAYKAVAGQCFALGQPMMQDVHNRLLVAAEAASVRSWPLPHP